MISNDKRIADPNSDSAKRMIDYGSLCDRLDIAILGYGGKNFALRDKINIIPTSDNKLASIIKAVFSLRKISGRFDLITCHDPFFAGLVGWSIKKPKTRLQLQLHTDIMSPYFHRLSLVNKLRFHLAMFLLPRASCIRVVSQRIKNSLDVKFKSLKIFVLPIFVDVEKIRRFAPTLNLHQKYPNYRNIILMASRITEEKNFNLALGAFKKIVGPFPDTLLLIVGDGPVKPYLESRIINLGLHKNVIIEPWTQNLISYYKTADSYLLTSNFEGYSRTVVEAMIAGCPVIMTDVGIAGEILIDKQSGLIVPVNNPETLGEAIFKLLENRDFARMLAENASDTVGSLPSFESYLKDYQKTFISC